MAVGTVAGAMFAAPNIIFRRPFDVIGDDQIEPAILVVVEPTCAGGPSAFVGYPRFFGDVSKCAVAVVVVQRGAQWMRRFVNVGGGGLHEEKIHQAVLVVVEPGYAGAHGLQIIFFFGLSCVLKECDSRLFAYVGVTDGNGRLLWFNSLTGKQQMGGSAKYCGKRQNCADFDSEAENGSSNYFQFAPIPPGYRGHSFHTSTLAHRILAYSDQISDCSAGYEGAQRDFSGA